ncbi:hypothetical protein ACYCFK_17730 [Stutzerimonas stutzeri]
MIKFVEDSPDLNVQREQLKRSLERALSWESELVDRESDPG